MTPGDIIFYRDKKFGHHRFYQIEGVHLGGEKQVSYIALRPLNENPALDECGDVMEVMNVPEPLLREAELYCRAKP